jgi:hypothetical protein
MSTKTKKVKATGDCYEAAIKAVWDIPEDEQWRYRVVHGYPTGQGKIAGVEHSHAWVERTDDVPPEAAEYGFGPECFTSCIDKSNGKDIEVPRGLYYGIGNIDPARCLYYEVREACRMVIEYGHWGRWEEA